MIQARKEEAARQAKPFEFRYLLALEPRVVIARLSGGNEREAELSVSSLERA